MNLFLLVAFPGHVEPPVQPEKGWVNMETVEAEKLAWMKDLPQPTAGDGKVRNQRGYTEWLTYYHFFRCDKELIVRHNPVIIEYSSDKGKKFKCLNGKGQK